MNAGNFGVDLEGLDPATRRELLELLRMQACERAQAAESERARIGRLNQNTARSVDGLGEVTMRLHPFDRFYHQVMDGVDPQDPEGQEWLRRKHDYARVESRGTKIMVGGVDLHRRGTETAEESITLKK